MKVLQEADELCSRLKDGAKAKMVSLSQDKTAYKELLKKLIVEVRTPSFYIGQGCAPLTWWCRAQALIRMNETTVSVVCRKEDEALVKGVLPEATKMFQQVAAASNLPYMQAVAKTCNTSVSSQTYLPPAPDSAKPDMASWCVAFFHPLRLHRLFAPPISFCLALCGLDHWTVE